METPTPYTPHIPAGFCSYPTYEEWKHFLTIVANLTLDSSYPTYEEWKHNKLTR